MMSALGFLDLVSLWVPCQGEEGPNVLLEVNLYPNARPSSPQPFLKSPMNSIPLSKWTGTPLPLSLIVSNTQSMWGQSIQTFPNQNSLLAQHYIDLRVRKFDVW